MNCTAKKLFPCHIDDPCYLNQYIPTILLILPINRNYRTCQWSVLPESTYSWQYHWPVLFEINIFTHINELHCSNVLPGMIYTTWDKYYIPTYHWTMLHKTTYFRPYHWPVLLKKIYICTTVSLILNITVHLNVHADRVPVTDLVPGKKQRARRLDSWPVNNPLIQLVKHDRPDLWQTGSPCTPRLKLERESEQRRWRNHDATVQRGRSDMERGGEWAGNVISCN